MSEPGPEVDAAVTARWSELEAVAATRGLATAAATSLRPKAWEDATATVMDGASRAPGGELGGAWSILDKLGQGGCGAVYRALQPGLGREVALKVLLDTQPGPASAFLAEARVTGYLEHAHIVPVHELGKDPAGAPRLAMKLVRGDSWSDRIAARQGSLQDHVRTLVAVCHAATALHTAFMRAP